MTYVDSKRSDVQPAPRTAFDEVACGAFLWTLNAYLNRDKVNTTLEELLDQDITIEQLNEIYCYLTQTDLVEPFPEADLMGFLKITTSSTSRCHRIRLKSKTSASYRSCRC